MSKFSKTLNIFSIVFLTLFALFILIISWLNPDLSESGLVLFAVSYCCAVVPLGLASATWLAWTNRNHLAKVYIWLVFQALFVISIAAYSLPEFGLFFSSLLFILFPLMGFVDFLYSYQQGASLKFIAWGSVVFIWSILLAWKITSNLFEVWIENLSAGSNNLWWLYASMYGTAWMILAGIVAFLVETINALRKEYYGA